MRFYLLSLAFALYFGFALAVPKMKRQTAVTCDECSGLSVTSCLSLLEGIKEAIKTTPLLEELYEDMFDEECEEEVGVCVAKFDLEYEKLSSSDKRVALKSSCNSGVLFDVYSRATMHLDSGSCPTSCATSPTGYSCKSNLRNSFMMAPSTTQLSIYKTFMDFSVTCAGEEECLPKYTEKFLTLSKEEKHTIMLQACSAKYLTSISTPSVDLTLFGKQKEEESCSSLCDGLDGSACVTSMESWVFALSDADMEAFFTSAGVEIDCDDMNPIGDAAKEFLDGMSSEDKLSLLKGGCSSYNPVVKSVSSCSSLCDGMSDKACLSTLKSWVLALSDEEMEAFFTSAGVEIDCDDMNPIGDAVQELFDGMTDKDILTMLKSGCSSYTPVVQTLSTCSSLCDGLDGSACVTSMESWVLALSDANMEAFFTSAGVEIDCDDMNPIGDAAKEFLDGMSSEDKLTLLKGGCSSYTTTATSSFSSNSFDSSSTHTTLLAIVGVIGIVGVVGGYNILIKGRRQYATLA